MLSHSFDIWLFIRDENMTPARPKDTGTWDVNTTIALSALEICKKLYFVKVSQN